MTNCAATWNQEILGLMSAFHYIAVDAAGQRQTGLIEASTEEVARAELIARGFDVLELQIKAASPPATPLSPRDFVQGGSLSLLTNLRALSEDLPSPQVRAAVTEMADRIERGESVPMGLEAVKQRLPTGMKTLLELGLQRGQMDVLLSVYLDHARRLSDIRTSLWTALAYPAFLIAVVCVGIVVLATLVIPMFEGIFRDFGVELPGLTKFILAFAIGIRTHAIDLPLTAAALAGLAWLLLRLAGGRSLPQWLFRQIPCIGSVYRWSSLASCSETLAMLVELETPLPEAFRTAATTCDDLSLAEGLVSAADAIEQGTADPRQPIGLPAELASAFRWADRPGLLVEGLRSSSEIFAARSRVDLHLARWILEPLIIFVVACSVGLSFLSLFMPLGKLLNDLS